ncbi:MAG: J domain-containing protein [Planctomycetota bacterium]
MTPARDRERPRYGAAPTKTRRELLRELELIGAKACFIQAAYRDDQIRLDGLPKAGAKPSHPGIILTYTGKDGQPYDLPCDTFRDAEQNLRAIVLTLQRLRLIDETGVKTHGRQYAGFKRLGGPGTAAVEPAFTVESAAAWLAEQVGFPEWSGLLVSTREDFCRVYRTAAKRLHPDVGGSEADFKRLQEAKRVLDEHHGKAVSR